MMLHIKNGAALHTLIANRNICHLGVKGISFVFGGCLLIQRVNRYF